MAKTPAAKSPMKAIRKASTETSEKREVGLEESTYTDKSGKLQTSLAVTENGNRVMGLSFQSRKWLLVLDAIADGGAEAIREWCRANSGK